MNANLMSPKELSVSIVVHNPSINQLEKAVSCLRKSDVKKIYIIDNSDKASDYLFIENIPEVIYYHVKNRGYGAGHNIALREAIKSGFKYHLVMNVDIVWEGHVIEFLINQMRKDAKIGLIAPKVFYPDGVLQYTCRMLPKPIDLFYKRFLPNSIKKKKINKYLLVNHNHDFPLNCPYLQGSFLLFRNEALENEGLFDERFFMYPEDIDICRRIHEKWKTMYWPEVSIIHEHQAASRKNLKMFWIHFVNMIKYFNKWGWIKDKKRDIYNKELEKSIVTLPKDKPRIGRG